MAQSLAVDTKTYLQGSSCFEHGSQLQIRPSITIPHAKLSMEEPQHGLSKAADFEIGRRMAPCCGSLAIVRSSHFFLSLTVDSLPDFAAGAGKSILWYASSLLSVRGN